MSLVLMVNPACVNLPSVKAMAAEHGVDVVGSRWCPFGQVFLMDFDATRYPEEDA